MQLITIRRLLLDELQEIYISELIAQEALPRIIAGVDSPDLRKAFEQHAEQTKLQIGRLETMFEQLEASPRGGHGRSMRALLKEIEDRMGEGGEPHVVDASLIVAGKRLEHWEIASYSVMATYARAMKLPPIADLLEKTLAEEQAMDDRLSAIAKEVNVEDPNSTQAKQPK